MTIQSNRSLGGYGACLIALGIISTVISFFQSLMLNSLGVSLSLSLVSGIVGLFSLIGIILVLIAMSGFASDYQEPRIMNNIWKAIITIIIGVVIIVIVAFTLLILNLFTIIPSNSNNGSTVLASTQATQVATNTEKWITPILPIAGFVGLIAIVFVMRSLNLLAGKSEVSLFRVTGKVLLTSILVTIISGIIFAAVSAYISVPYASISLIGIPGGIIQEVAWILLAMAYFRIKPPVVPTQPIQTTPSVSLPVSGQVKYCTYCGSQNPVQAVYCTHCGQKM